MFTVKSVKFGKKMFLAGMAVLMALSIPVTPAMAAEDIGEDQAQQIALEQAGLTAEEVSRLRAVQDRDDGSLEYEVEFFTDTTEYDYEIDAATGIIWKESQEILSRGRQDAGDVGSDAAQEAALAHAEMALEDVISPVVRKELDDGYLEYEVTWLTDTDEYEYIIDGAAGTVWQWERTVLPAARQTLLSAGAADNTAAKAEDVGAEAARDAALAKAGLALDQVTGMHVEWETCDDFFSHHGHGLSHNHNVYEISFRAGREEYECVVDSATGEVLEFEHEFDD